MDFSALHSLTLIFWLLMFPIIKGASITSEGSAIATIRNNLNLYSTLIDTKNFEALDQVFTPDASPAGLIVSGNDTYPNNLTGIKMYLRDFLGDAISLHYVDTQHVALGPTGDTAISTTYVQATGFAKDANATGQILVLYGRYTDDFVLKGDQWLSRNKTLQVTVSFLSSSPSSCKSAALS